MAVIFPGLSVLVGFFLLYHMTSNTYTSYITIPNSVYPLGDEVFGANIDT